MMPKLSAQLHAAISETKLGGYEIPTPKQLSSKGKGRKGKKLPRLAPKAVQTLRNLADHGTLYTRHPGTGYYWKWYTTPMGTKAITGMFTPTLYKMEDLGLIVMEVYKGDDDGSEIEKWSITQLGRETLAELEAQGGGASKGGKKRFLIKVSKERESAVYVKTVRRGWGSRGIFFTSSKGDARTFAQSQVDKVGEMVMDIKGVIGYEGVPV